MKLRPGTTSEIRETAPGRRDRPTVALYTGRDERLMRTIVAEARSREWQLVDVGFCGGELPPSIACQGAFVATLPGSREVRRLQQSGCAVVRLGHLPHPRDAELPCVLPDDSAAGAMAAEHFAQRGFRDVGFVGRKPWSDYRTLFEGFRDRAKALDLTCHLLRFKSESPDAPETGPARYQRRQHLFGEWLQGIPKPLGLLAYGDGVSAQFCFMSAQSGFAIPTDVAVLGYGNDTARCECSLPTLSSIDPGVESRGRAACRLLGELMDGAPAPTEPVVVPPRGVVVRESTDVLATPDPHVATALRYMWVHLDQDLSVDTVARVVGISRRKLERHFRREVGHGINSELRRKRLETLCMLLRTSDRPIADLAPLVGFKSTDYLHRTFRRAFGITPRRYRLRLEGQCPGPGSR